MLHDTQLYKRAGVWMGVFSCLESELLPTIPAQLAHKKCRRLLFRLCSLQPAGFRVLRHLQCSFLLERLCTAGVQVGY